ncbi:hypothetical protein P8625_15030 [Tenacibaculum tangerinum]|uniref:Lipoprotein n=1 Tax=Tenacibaculum tangerinum TaxID=3038772 RepID=A0ABY8L270_9FLAO|nr:hypothetical protein [Tenacibaculum tangerinum]WGH75366.1 hypothetical protein P8625_15030 [Tenacibaculum tangerinum]
MKHLLLLVTITFVLSCCSKDDNDPKEPLPPATQTGAGTFACKINGQNFIDTSSGYFNCYYQFIDGAYYFGISGIDNNMLPGNVFFGTTKKTVSEGEVLKLLEISDGNASGGGDFLFLQQIIKYRIPQQIILVSLPLPGSILPTRLYRVLFGLISNTLPLEQLLKYVKGASIPCLPNKKRKVTALSLRNLKK